MTIFPNEYQKECDEIVKSLNEVIKELKSENDKLKRSLPELKDIDFKSLREYTGFTLRDVTKLTNLSTSYLSQLETGKIDNPSYNTVRSLLKIYGYHTSNGKMTDFDKWLSKFATIGNECYWYDDEIVFCKDAMFEIFTKGSTEIEPVNS